MDSGSGAGATLPGAEALVSWLRYFGAEGVRERVREHIRLARRVAERVEAAPVVGDERSCPPSPLRCSGSPHGVWSRRSRIG